MSDAQLTWFDYGADISILNGDIAPDNGLATSVLISLFTDARAASLSLVPIGESNLRGWWGDIDENHTTGSLLWLINREKTVNEVAIKAKEYCETALEWLLDENIASDVTVETLLIRPYSLQIKIFISRGNSKLYSYLWDAVQEYKEITVQNTTVQIEFI